MQRILRSILLLALAAPAAPLAAQGLGSPNVISVTPATDTATAEVVWQNPFAEPDEFLGLAWDLYANDWIVQSFDSDATTGTMAFGTSGGYLFFLSSLYPTAWTPPTSVWPRIVFGGPPHAPRGPGGGGQFIEARDNGDGSIRLSFTPDPYGTFGYGIIAYNINANQYTLLTAFDAANEYWHFLWYGTPQYNGGMIELSLPADVFDEHWFFMQGIGWDLVSGSEWSAAYVDPFNIDDDFVGTYRGSFATIALFSGLTGTASFNVTVRIDSWDPVGGSDSQYSAQGLVTFQGSVRVDDPFPGGGINRNVNQTYTFVSSQQRIKIDAFQRPMTYRFEAEEQGIRVNLMIDEFTEREMDGEIEFSVAEGFDAATGEADITLRR